MRILVVEDEILVAMMVTECLERCGHVVLGPAATASEAIALCETLLPELALIDINLRDGSNGVCLARALFTRWGLPVIFASSQLLEARQASAIALGYIGKPYEAETVLRSLEVAAGLLRGEEPGKVPAGFELFRAVC